MPTDIDNLTGVLAEMKGVYLADPDKAVRSAEFIKPLHNFCVDELVRKGIPDNKIFTEAQVFGSHKRKRVDVAVIDPTNGPMIVIGVRSQMSSIGNNILTYYEEIIGDCISLHDRFPMAVINYVYLLPSVSIKPGHAQVSINLERFEQLYKIITNRGDWRNTKDKYEHFAFLKVNFTTDPPTLLDTIEELRINHFFDKILNTHNERNVFDQYSFEDAP